MAAEYDVFLSHAWADGDRPREIAEALTKAGLRVWFDADEINDFASITRAVTEGLAHSKALLAYYSKIYPLRRACQWELTAAFLASQTENDPRRRVLVISPEENADHIHPIELRDAKFRNTPKNSGAALQELVQSVVKHVAGLEGLLADIHPLTPPQWYGRTPVGSTRFIGRLAQMWQVHSMLHAGDVVQITGATTASGGIGRVSGLGGVGKSLLAEEYAIHFGAAYPGGVFWLRAHGNDDAKTILGPEHREALRYDQVRQMTERLGAETSGRTEEQIEGELARKIASVGKPCLWIVDDIPNGLNGEALRRWFAPHPLARTLITTRSGEYGSLTKGLDLAVLRPDESEQLLTSRRRPVNIEEEQQARGLAKDLGHHALALDVTASALLSWVADKPFADFRSKLARPDRDALALAETLADALPNGHEKSIAQTMLRSIGGLGAEGLDFLRLASVLAVAPIPASLVTAVFKQADKLGHEDAQEHASLAFQQATAASLAEIAGEQQDARAVHTLVSRVVRFQEKGVPSRTETLRAAAIEALKSRMAQAAGDPRLHKQIELHAEHARHVAASLVSAEEANLVHWLARYDYERGVYSSARLLQEREVEFRKLARGADHPDTLTAMNNLAATLSAQGDLARARRLFEHVLEVRTRVLGEEHPDTVTAMSNLADTIGEQGGGLEKRRMQEHVVEVRTRVLGKEHAGTLGSMNNLASTLRAQGDYAEARRLQDRVLEVGTRVLGDGHPYTLAAMNNLASTLRAQGDYAEARRLLEHVLEVRRRMLGEEWPHTLTTMNDLALTLWEQGDHAQARRLLEHALEVRRRMLGEEWPDSLISMSNLALMLSEHGNHAEAQRLHEQVLEARTRVLGTEHPDTLASTNNLASVLREKGDHAQARRLHERVLEVQTRVLGDEHRDTLTSMHNLALTLREQGDYAGARQLQEQVLEVRTRVLGKEHPYTLTSISNLALTLREQGDHAGARRLHERVLEAQMRVLGEEHPDTLHSMNNLAETLWAQGFRARTRELHERALKVRRRVLGEDHLDTMASMSNLASTLAGEGDYAEARRLHEHVLGVLTRVLGEEHPRTLISMNNIALSLGAQGDRAEERRLHERVLDARSRILGVEHPDTLLSMWNLGLTLLHVGEDADALEYLRKCLAGRRKIFGDQHPDTLNTAEILERFKDASKSLRAK